MTIVLASPDFRRSQFSDARVVSLIDGELLPFAVDAAMTGRIRQEGNQWIFHTAQGLVIQLPRAATMMWDNSAKTRIDGLFQLVIDGSRVELRPATADTPGQLGGRIAAVRQHAQRCQVEVALAGGQTLTADISAECYQRSGLNIGTRVALDLGPEAVRLIPRQTTA